MYCHMKTTLKLTVHQLPRLLAVVIVIKLTLSFTKSIDIIFAG